MKINIKKIIVYALVFIIIFQDSFTELLKISALNYIDEVFILGYFLYALISLIYSKKQINKNILKIFAMLLAFWTTGIIGSLLYSSYNKFSLIMASFLMTKFFILIISVYIKAPTKNIQEYIIRAVKLIGKISLVAGLINLILPSLWIKLIPYTYIYRRNGLNSIMGLFIHAGQYGWFMMMVAILYYVEYKYGHKEKNKKWFLIYAIAAILSLKVKVIITFIAILLFDNLILNRPKIKTVVLLIISIVSIYFMFGDLILQTYTQYFTNSTSDISARYALLSGSKQIMKDYFPIGVGFSKFASWYARINYSEYYYIYGCSTVYGLRPDNAFFATDTFWPSIFGETGVLGTVFYIMLLFHIFKLLYKKTKHNQNLSAIFAILIFVQALVESTGEAIFNSSPQNIVIAFFIGLALNKKIYKEKLR